MGKVIINENELRQIVTEAVEEGWLGRNFRGAAGRAQAQVNDAIKRLDVAMRMFNNPAGARAGNYNYQTAGQWFGNAIEFLIRAKNNNVQPQVLKPGIDKLIQSLDSLKQTMNTYLNGGQQQQGQEQIASDWKTAEAEIGKVVGNNYSGWPQKCKQAGWSDQKIAAYRKLANANSRRGNKMNGNANQVGTGMNATQLNGGQVMAQNQQSQPQQQLAESISKAMDNVLKKYTK